MGNSWHRQSWPGFRLDETVDNKTQYMSFKLNFHGKKCRNQFVHVFCCKLPEIEGEACCSEAQGKLVICVRWE